LLKITTGVQQSVYEAIYINTFLYFSTKIKFEKHNAILLPLMQYAWVNGAGSPDNIIVYKKVN